MQASVFGKARVSGNASVHGEACVYGNAQVYGVAILNVSMQIRYGSYGIEKYTSPQDFLIKYIAAALNAYPINNKYILYKKVRSLANETNKFRSCYDSGFIYTVNGYAIAKNYDKDILISCGTGLHVSYPDYWDSGDVLLVCEIDIEDIITCMNSKLRVKKLKVLDYHFLDD